MLKNSKAFKFLIGTFAVLALGAVLTASAAMDFGPSTLKVGSKGEYVKTLQTLVGASPVDGIFGKGTEGKVKAWQANCGLTADGKFGPASKAKAATGCSTTVVTPAQGNCPTGYVAVTPVAPTWAACAMATATNTGTNGYLTDINTDSTNKVSTVYESEMDKVVGGMRATARLADQTVTRVRVTFKNSGTGSMDLGKYITGATLWMDSTKLATMSVAQADRSNTDDTFTFNFSGLNAKIAKDMVGRFYVSVSANGSLDTANTGAGSNFTVKFTASGVNASSPDGTYDTYPSSDLSVATGLSFGKFSANGVKAEINLSASNPAASVVTVQNTASTNAVTLLKFTIKATNSTLKLRKVPIQVVSSSANVSAVVNTLKLYNGTNLLQSVDGSTGYTISGGAITATTTAGAASTGYLFDSLSTPSNEIASGTTAEFSVVADLKQVSGNYSEGNTLTASFTNADAVSSSPLNFSVYDGSGDQLTASSTYRTGSGVGQVMTLRINGVNVVMGSPTISTTSASTAGVINSITYNVPLTVTAFGQTQYVGQAAQFAATTSSTNALAFALQASTAPATDVTTAPAGTGVTQTLASSDALIDGSGYRLDSGTAKHFTVQVILSCSTPADCTGASTANYRVQLKDVKTFTDNALSAGAAVQSLLPQSNFQTGYQKIK